MDNTEIHYLTYDPDEIFRQMQLAYLNAGGDVLYPGDEKEMLLRAVQAIFVQAFAGVDNALRMATLRYAMGDYLDLYGEKRDCLRKAAECAHAKVRITWSISASSMHLAAGTALTADGRRVYRLTQEAAPGGGDRSVETDIVCSEEGSAGNALKAGTQMQFILPQSGVESVYVTEDASGGRDREEDEAYRERIRLHGLADQTTGAKSRYEAVAKDVSGDIADARAQMLQPGKVGVYLLLTNSDHAQDILPKVEQALSSSDVRPLTDQVQVFESSAVPYKIVARCTIDTTSTSVQNLQIAADEYTAWQDGVIGRPFNPDRLMALLYAAGAMRVQWGEDSSFDNGEIAYTEIEDCAHCKGEVRLEVIGG